MPKFIGFQLLFLGLFLPLWVGGILNKKDRQQLQEKMGVLQRIRRWKMTIKSIEKSNNVGDSFVGGGKLKERIKILHVSIYHSG